MNSKNIPQVSLLRFLKHSTQILKNPLPFHHENFEKSGDTFRLRIGLNSTVIFSRDAGLAQYVLKTHNKNFSKSKIQTEDLSKYIGYGLLTAEGEHWKKQRRLIQPAFHKSYLEGLLGSMESAVDFEYQKIVPGELDIFPIFNDLAFITVVKCLFKNVATQEEINRLQFITEAAQKMLVKELRQPYLGVWFKYSGKIDRHLRLTQEAREILKVMVKKRIDSGERQDDLLDMLLEAKYEDGESMEEDQLLDEILILFTAGHETTSNALSFTIQLLALHPEWQERLYNEVKNLDESSLMSKLKGLEKTQWVIEESMRLYPPVYFMDRLSEKDFEFGNYKFQTGENILFSIYEIHRDKEYWDNPNDFNPERFSEGGNQYSSHYFPFGAGPRKCIGSNFAMFEMILAISELVERYKIYPKFSEIEIKPLITMKPRNAQVILQSR